MRTISQLEDYHNELEDQKIQKALYEAACLESEVKCTKFTLSTELHFVLYRY